MFITERADGAADRLEAVLKAQREAPAAAPPAAPSAAQAMSAEAARRRPPPRVDADGVAADAKGAQSRLSSLLKQAESPPRPAAPPPPAAEEPERAAPQSRAERDLLRALEGRR
jgi:hypothetical protein